MMESYQVCRHWLNMVDGCDKCLSPECWDIYQVSFKVTGVLRTGTRFPAIRTDSYLQAMGINLYCGNVWALFHQDGALVKRRIIKTVYN